MNINWSDVCQRVIAYHYDESHFQMTESNVEHCLNPVTKLVEFDSMWTNSGRDWTKCCDRCWEEFYKTFPNVKVTEI
jgi:hypothetical protein